MGITFESTPIFCPIDGLDLAILGGYDDGPTASRPPTWASASTVTRRCDALARLGLLERPPGRQRSWTSRLRGWRLGQLLREVQRERPDLLRLLTTPADLAVLLTLAEPPHPFEPWDLACVSRTTWHDRVAHLAKHALVLRRPYDARPNQRITTLAGLLNIYREICGVVDPRPPAERTGEPPLRVHQRGVEIAWRSEPGVQIDATPVGPDYDNTTLNPLRLVHQHWYHGRRRLDALDHTLLPMCHGRSAAPRAVSPIPDDHWTWGGARQTAFVYARLGAEGVARPAVRARCDFYGLNDLYAALREISRGNHEGIAAQANDLRERGVSPLHGL